MTYGHRFGLIAAVGGVTLAVTGTSASAAWEAPAAVVLTATADQLAAPSAPAAHLDDTAVRVTWSAPMTDSPPSSWQVRRGSALVCTVPAATTACTDSLAPLGQPLRYTVRGLLEAWVGADSEQSGPVTVALSVPALTRKTLTLSPRAVQPPPAEKTPEPPAASSTPPAEESSSAPPADVDPSPGPSD